MITQTITRQQLVDEGLWPAATQYDPTVDENAAEHLKELFEQSHNVALQVKLTTHVTAGHGNAKMPSEPWQVYCQQHDRLTPIAENDSRALAICLAVIELHRKLTTTET